MARNSRQPRRNNHPSSVKLLQRLENGLDAFVDASVDAFLLFDDNLDLMSINPAGERLFGVSKEMVVGKNIVELEPDIKETGKYDKYLDVMKTGDLFFVEEPFSHPKFGDMRLSIKAFKVREGLGMIVNDITERRRMEKALQESELLATATIEQMSDGVMLVGMDGKVTYVNKAFEKLLGHKADEVVGTSALELPTYRGSKDKKKARQALKMVIEKGSAEPIDMLALTKGGEEIPISFTASMIRDAKGNPKTLVAVLSDVTERRQAEEKLRRSEEYFRALTENALDGILILNGDGSIRYESPSVQKLIGYGPEQREGRSVFEHIHPDDLHGAAKNFDKLVHTPGSIFRTEIRAQHKDGSWHNLEVVSSNLLDNSAVKGVVLNLRDSTERKRTEEALTESEEHLRRLVDQAPDIIFRWSADKGLEYCSPIVSEITGYTPEELLSEPMVGLELAKGMDLGLAEDYERAVVQGASIRHREISFTRKDGKRIYLEVRSHAVRDKAGKVIAYEGVLRDITERKRMEEEVRLLSDAVKMTTDSVAITDMSGRILDINEAGLRMYGLSDRADFVGRNPLDAIAPEDRREAIENMAKLVETGQVNGIEYHVLRKDGSRILIETSVSVIKGGNGEPKGLVAVARDITERKRMEEALRKQTHYLGERVKEISCIQAISDIFGKQNVSLEEVLQGIVDVIPSGWQYPEITSARISLGDQEFITKNFRVTNWKQSSDIVAHGNRLGTVEVCYLEEKPEMDEGPFLKEERALINVITERLGRTTERREAEAALRESEERFRRAINATEGGLWEWDILTGQEFFSPHWCEIIGYSFDDPELTHSYNSWADRIHPDDSERVMNTLKNHLEKGAKYDVDYRHRHKSGEYRWQNSKGHAVLDKSGKPIKMVGCISDITERKKAEEALKYSEEYFRALTENMSDAITVLDADGILRYESPSVESVLGYKAGERSGTNGLDFVHPDDVQNAAEDLAKLIQHPGSSIRTELRAKHGDGSWRAAEITAANLLDNPAVGGIVINFRDITERKKAQEALKQSEKKYRQLFESMQEGLWLIDKDSITTFVNPRMAEILGYTAEEMLGKHLFAFMDECGIEVAKYDLERRRQGIKEQHDFEFTRKDGARVYASLETSPITDEAGNYVGALACVADVTERKKAEDKVRLSEFHLQELLGLHRMTASTEKEILNFTLEASVRSLQSPFAFIGIMSADEAAMTIHAWSKGAMEQCAITEKPIHFPIAEAGLWGEAVRQRRPIVVNDYDTSTEFKKGYPKSHVPIKRFLCIPVFSASRIVAVAAVANKVSEYDETDISALISLIHEMWNLVERKQGEEALRLSEEKYRLLVDNASEAIVVIQDGMFKFFNDRAVELLGYSREELASKPFIELIHPDDQRMLMERYLERLKGGNPPSLYSFKVINKAGNVLWGEVNAVAITWEGRPATLNFLTDVTERKKAEEEKQRMEEQLRLAGRLAAVGELSAGVAHELNNPIAAIQGFAQLLTGRNDLDETMKKDLGIIYREAQRAAKITQNLLSFARRHEPEKHLISLNEVIEKTLELRAHQMKVNNIEVVVEFATDLPKTTADFFQMQQVFVNILNNAEQAMVEAHRKGRLVVKTQKAGNMIQATFADDGPGISEDNLKRIFDPFFTTKEVGKGTGLGLSICYGIVEAHGGRIYARSKLGQGATVVVEIPIVSEGQ